MANDITAKIIKAKKELMDLFQNGDISINDIITELAVYYVITGDIPGDVKLDYIKKV